MLGSLRTQILAGVALLVVICLGVGGYVWYHSTHVPSDVAFRVYGQNVPISELNDMAQTDGALYGFVPPTSGPQVAQFRKDIAKASAVSMIIDHAAAERNIVIANRQAEDQLSRFIAGAYGPGEDGHTKFVQSLANQGTSEPKVIAEFKRQMTLSKLAEQITAGVQVNDQELQDYFNAHKADLATPEVRDLHNIVVATKAEADLVVDQLNHGGNFEQLAAQHSMDPTTKTQGGALGQHAAQDFEPSYAAAAFSAPVNGIFGPVQGQHGWNVGKVVSITPPAPAQFAQIKDQLRQYLITKKDADIFRTFLTKEIKDADVVYNPEYRPDDPYSLPQPGGPPGQGAAQSASAPGQPGQPAPPAK
jgi:peptidyl-prolyl cis-trans isomerase C